jgi:hypothetical protein
VLHHWCVRSAECLAVFTSLAVDIGKIYRMGQLLSGTERAGVTTFENGTHTWFLERLLSGTIAMQTSFDLL